jgi:hypothetical protein
MKKLLFVVLATIFSTTMFAQAAKKKLTIKTPFLPISQLNMSLNEGKKINGDIDVTMPMIASIKTYAKEESSNA